MLKKSYNRFITNALLILLFSKNGKFINILVDSINLHALKLLLILLIIKYYIIV